MRALCLATAALAVVGGSCAPLSYGIYCPPGDPRCAEIDAARGAWNVVTRADHRLYASQDSDDWIINFAAVVDSPRGRCAGCSGYTKHGERVVQIRSDLRGDDLRRCATHELGHALLLSHTCADPDFAFERVAPSAGPCGSTSVGVMDPAHPSGSPLPLDLDECKHVGACP